MAAKAIAASVLASAGGYMVYLSTLPRGVRNNNPLNIQEGQGDSTKLVGESAIDSDKAFEEFKHPVYGFRAGARVLRSYNRQGYRTLTQIISRFAPATENNTALYIQQVSQWTGIGEHQVVDVHNNAELARLLHAMSRKEVGGYYGLKMAEQGVAMA